MIDANENRSEGELKMKNLNDNSSAKRKRTFETFVHGIFLILGLVTVACVLLISIYLIVSGIPAIRQIGLINLLFGKKWEPTAATPAFGILPFILTSIYGTAGAIILGVPIGFLASVYLAKAAKPKLRAVAESAVSLLAGIPSVVYGLVGMLVLVPGIRNAFNLADGFRPLGRNNRTCDYDSALNHKSVHDCS